MTTTATIMRRNLRPSFHSLIFLYVSVPPPRFQSGLSCSFSQWLADGSPTPLHIFSPCLGKSNCLYALSEVSYFYVFGKAGSFGFPGRILRDTGTGLFKARKTGRNGIRKLEIIRSVLWKLNVRTGRRTQFAQRTHENQSGV
jgi:hypothetical protein